MKFLIDMIDRIGARQTYGKILCAHSVRNCPGHTSTRWSKFSHFLGGPGILHPSVSYAHLGAICGSHCGEEVVHFSQIHWLLFFIWVDGDFWFWFCFFRNTQRVRECWKPSKLAQAFSVILLNDESCLAQGLGYSLTHYIHHPIEMEVASAEYVSAKEIQVKGYLYLPEHIH